MPRHARRHPDVNCVVIDSGGPKEAYIEWGSAPPYEWAIIGGRGILGVPDDTLP